MWFALGVVETLGLGSEDEGYGYISNIGEADDSSAMTVSGSPYAYIASISVA